MLILFITTVSIPITYASDLQPMLQKSGTVQETYSPGLGEFMLANQMRHAKLWFAGKDENWELARYELDEIKEGFEDAGKFNPVFKGTDLSEMLDKLIGKPLLEVGKAIELKDGIKFVKAFENLTNGCNSCHQATRHGFIIIKIPTIPPASNQDFSKKPNQEK